MTDLHESYCHYFPLSLPLIIRQDHTGSVTGGLTPYQRLFRLPRIVEALPSIPGSRLTCRHGSRVPANLFSECPL